MAIVENSAFQGAEVSVGLSRVALMLLRLPGCRSFPPSGQAPVPPTQGAFWLLTVDCAVPVAFLRFWLYGSFHGTPGQGQGWAGRAPVTHPSGPRLASL